MRFDRCLVPGDEQQEHHRAELVFGQTVTAVAHRDQIREQVAGRGARFSAISSRT